MHNLFKVRLFHQIEQQNKEQLKIVIYSCIYFFSLLCSYFILRPVRDEMGIVNGAINMQWLFTGTFVAMVCVVPLFGFLVSKRPIKKVLLYSYSFFVGTILLFYFLFINFGITRIWAIAFFICVSRFFDCAAALGVSAMRSHHFIMDKNGFDCSGLLRDAAPARRCGRALTMPRIP